MPQPGTRLGNKRFHDEARVSDFGSVIPRDPTIGLRMPKRNVMPNVIPVVVEPNAGGECLRAEVRYSARWCRALANKIDIA